MHTDTDRAVAAECGECLRTFFVTEEPETCPHCGSDDVGTGHGVVVRPH